MTKSEENWYVNYEELKARVLETGHFIPKHSRGNNWWLCGVQHKTQLLSLVCLSGKWPVSATCAFKASKLDIQFSSFFVATALKTVLLFQ